MSARKLHPNPKGYSFHDAVSPVIYFVQFLGIMPLKGLKSHNLKTIKFAYISLSMLSGLSFLICDLMVIVTCIMYYKAIDDLNISTAGLLHI